MKGYHPQNWVLGEVVEILDGRARVLERSVHGKLDVHRSLMIVPGTHRAIIISVEGMFFSSQVIVTAPGEIHIGSAVIIEKHSGSRGAWGWALLNHYREAFDIYHARYSPRVVGSVRRRLHTPDEMRYPDRPYLSEIPAPAQPFERVSADISQALAAAPIVRFYPDDPEFEASLSAEELEEVRGMSQYQRRKFRRNRVRQVA